MKKLAVFMIMLSCFVIFSACGNKTTKNNTSVSPTVGITNEATPKPTDTPAATPTSVPTPTTTSTPVPSPTEAPLPTPVPKDSWEEIKGKAYDYVEKIKPADARLSDDYSYLRNPQGEGSLWICHRFSDEKTRYYVFTKDGEVAGAIVPCVTIYDANGEVFFACDSANKFSINPEDPVNDRKLLYNGNDLRESQIYKDICYATLDSAVPENPAEIESALLSCDFCQIKVSKCQEELTDGGHRITTSIYIETPIQLSGNDLLYEEDQGMLVLALKVETENYHSNGYRTVYVNQVDYDYFWDSEGRNQGTIYDTDNNVVLSYDSSYWGATDGGGNNYFCIKDGSGKILADYPKNILEWDCDSIKAEYNAGSLKDDLESDYIIESADGHTIRLQASANAYVIFSLVIYLDDEYTYSFASFSH